MSNEGTYPQTYSETVLKVAHGKEQWSAPIANFVNRALTEITPNVAVYWNDEEIYILLRQYGTNNSDSYAVMMKTDEILAEVPYTEQYLSAQETLIAESDKEGVLSVTMYRETPKHEFMLMPELSNSLKESVNTSFSQRLHKHSVIV